MRTTVKYLIGGLSLIAAVSSYAKITLTADAETGVVLSFVALTPNAQEAIGQLGPTQFNKDLTNLKSLDSGSKPQSYFVQVTTNTPGSLQASTYCSREAMLFFPKGQGNTLIAFDPRTWTHECYSHP